MYLYICKLTHRNKYGRKSIKFNQMKTIVNEITGRKEFPIFKGTNEQIFNWVEYHLEELELNESWSCSAQWNNDNKTEIFIRGDEDFELFRIIDVKIIKL